MANEEQNPTAGSAFRPEITRRLPELPGGPLRGAAAPAPGDGGKKLIVGREIVLNGQITACDQLVVEGRVEAALENSQSIEISETGSFKGSAVIEEAIISGQFEGSLTVRGELTVKARGRIEGDVRYGKLSVESGGQIIGTLEALPDSGAGAASAAPASTNDDLEE
ncbi:MAG: polymer-forming cytoskeletal protein [Alphaproteobacteria bacterium]|jgi:cytoskeletal protein CcmA (bactofilin family)|nr:polymer-forming cytoskeletal protein [Alphaproteobacteria bacterium]MDP6830555.1 polymer-forming cytoskeletal protein [Alphaproteobacteria bacterium]MDP6875703.1 polymer-forming cytoskeletal protein [Alphaproteobacteria bacterium]